MPPESQLIRIIGEKQEEASSGVVDDIFPASPTTAMNDSPLPPTGVLKRAKSLSARSSSISSGTFRAVTQSFRNRNHSISAVTKSVPINLLAGLKRLRPIVMRTVPSERDQVR